MLGIVIKKHKHKHCNVIGILITQYWIINDCNLDDLEWQRYIALTVPSQVVKLSVCRTCGLWRCCGRRILFCLFWLPLGAGSPWHSLAPSCKLCHQQVFLCGSVPVSSHSLCVRPTVFALGTLCDLVIHTNSENILFPFKYTYIW